MRTSGYMGVILAAGRGARLGSLTSSIPKPLLEFENTRFIDYALTAFGEAGVVDLIVIVGYRAEQVISYIRAKPLPFQRIRFFKQDALGGSGQAVQLAAKQQLLDGSVFDAIVVAASDYVLPYGSVRQLLDTLQQQKAAIAVTCVSGTREESKKSALVNCSNGRITRIEEKPACIPTRKHYLLAKLNYAFTPEVFSEIAETSFEKTEGELSVPEIVSYFLDRGAVVVGSHSSRFLDADAIFVERHPE